MGLLSKIFGKKESEKNQEIKVEIRAELKVTQPDVPEFQGDYAKTIFLWAHDKACPIRKKEEYSQYFLYECGIRDAAIYHKKMISEGYFKEASLEARLATFKMPELKKILSDLGQTTTGKKDLLIQRIIESGKTDAIDKMFSETLYELSQLGKEFLNQHNDYVLVHKHRNWDVDWKEYDTAHKQGMSYYDTMWGIFNERLVGNPRHFGRGIYLNMYQLLQEEGKKERALEMLLRVLYIDLSGIEGDSIYEFYKGGLYTQEETIEYFDIAIMLAPGIINSVKEFKGVYNDSVVDKIYEQKLPMQVCKKELFFEIIHSLLEDTYNEEYFVKKLKAEFTKLIKTL